MLSNNLCPCGFDMFKCKEDLFDSLLITGNDDPEKQGETVPSQT
jgi:hypothetical protein